MTNLGYSTGNQFKVYINDIPKKDKKNNWKNGWTDESARKPIRMRSPALKKKIIYEEFTGN